ncbi:MAG: AraC family transcriptional regulator [Herbaspirillum sp.]
MTDDLSNNAKAPSLAPIRHGRVAYSYIQPLLEAAAARGVSAAVLARAVGLGDHGLDRASEFIYAETYIDLLDAGAKLCNDPNFGLHVGERVRLGTYNVYGLILLSCRDFGQVLQQTLRYEGLAHDLGRSEIVVNGEIAEYRWHSNFPHASRHLVDSVYAGIRVFSNWLAGQNLPSVDLALAHIRPDNCSEYERVFGALPNFNANGHCAHFSVALLQLPVPNADVSMYPVLQQHAEHLLREKQRAVTDGGIVATVRAAIIRQLPQDRARLSLIAEEFKLSHRALQRKLSGAGTCFQTVLDETRLELAFGYLRQAQFSLTDIAFLLGYQEQSSFNHAFKEWTGENPGAFRAKTRC